MAICVYKGVSRKGNPIWGEWVCNNGIEDSIVQHCRRAFGDKYYNMWIDPVYFDDKYFRWTEQFFGEVGVGLYPKLTKLPSRGEYADDSEWRTAVWRIVRDDIHKSIYKGVKPKLMVIKGIRVPDRDIEGSYVEKITGLYRVRRFKALKVEEL